MTALWIILAIALVLTVLNLLPVGVDAAYADDVFSLAARIGQLRSGNRKLLAQNVETARQLELCQSLGFDLKKYDM